MKKRIVALVSALTLVFAMSLNVAAAGSISADEVKDIVAEVGASDVNFPTDLTASAEALNKEGVMTGGTAETLKDANAVKTLAKEAAAVLAADDVESVEVAAVFELVSTQKKVTIKMSVGANQKVYALHVSGGKVNRIPGTVNGDEVTFESDSWSPVAIIKVTEKAAEAPATSTNQPAYNPQWDPTSPSYIGNTNASAPATGAVVAPVAPKTGDVVMMVSIMAIIFMAGAAVAVAMSKKRA